MKVFVVTEVEPEDAYSRSIAGIFETREKADAFVTQEQSLLAAGSLAGFPTEKTRNDVWWEIDEFIVQ